MSMIKLENCKITAVWQPDYKLEYRYKGSRNVTHFDPEITTKILEKIKKEELATLWIDEDGWIQKVK